MCGDGGGGGEGACQTAYETGGSYMGASIALALSGGNPIAGAAGAVGGAVIGEIAGDYFCGPGGDPGNWP